MPIHIKAKKGSEYFLNVAYKLIMEEPFIDAGFTIANDQFLWMGKPKMHEEIQQHGTLSIVNTGKTATIKGKDFSVLFDLEKGILGSYIVNGENYMQQGPLPGFWRAPTDNDIGAGFNSSLRKWRNTYQDAGKAWIVPVK